MRIEKISKYNIIIMVKNYNCIKYYNLNNIMNKIGVFIEVQIVREKQ